MSFLAPLYLLGLAAVSLPLVFHLIRRTPKGRFAFSSLMFLNPSPPRLTRRSRLDNVLLLLLRAAALILLAAAFARPFLRSLASGTTFDYAQRKVAIVVDTSASMQRENLWSQVSRGVDRVLDDLDPGDDVALYRFDDRHEALVRFDDLAPPDPANKILQVRTALRGLQPGWGGSQLGDALVAVADSLDRERAPGQREQQTTRQIVLFTDLQEGSRIDALRSYRWPDDVQLIVQPVQPLKTTNAGLHPAAASAEVLDGKMRVRVSNDRDSTGEQFQLSWEIEPGRPAVEPTEVYVPAGESRVVRVPAPAGSAAPRLVLTGDDHDYDNTLYSASRIQDQARVIYLGSDESADPKGLRYYLERAYPETPRRSVQLTAPDADEPLDPTVLADTRLVVIRDRVSADRVAPLQAYVQKGGTLLAVLTDPVASEGLTTLLDAGPLEIEEAELEDYALLGQIDFSDPLFTPFADPRFNDFTTIHFWKHRRLGTAEEESFRVLARFDDGDPALLERRWGAGQALLLTAGWQPDDSQLARSTKFVPLMHGLLDRTGGSGVVSSQYEVGQPVELPRVSGAVADRSVLTPDGTNLRLSKDQRVFERTDLPGVYTLSINGREQAFAVNVAAGESAISPLSPDELQEQGIRLGTTVTRAERLEQQRQLRDVELESRQKLWRWLIAAAVGLLLLETWLAGYLAHASVQSVETA